MKLHTGRSRFIVLPLLLIGGVVVVVTLFGPNLMAIAPTAWPKTARTQIENFSYALEQFKSDVGRYPTDSEGLQALHVKPDDSKEWNGPYIKKRIPRDPWDHPYIYRSNGEAYELLSYGRNSMPGGTGKDTDIQSRRVCP